MDADDAADAEPENAMDLPLEARAAETAAKLDVARRKFRKLELELVGALLDARQLELEPLRSPLTDAAPRCPRRELWRPPRLAI